MSKFWLLLLILVAYSQQGTTSPVCKLTILTYPDEPSKTGTSLQLYPAVYSSPVDNLNNQRFTVFRAQPIDGCTHISDPNFTGITGVQNNPYIVVIDGDSGFCGIKRRIQMAKNVGAKGVILLNDNLDNAFDPYGDFSDNTFLVFIATSADSKKLLKPQKYLVASLSTTSGGQEKTKQQVQLWVSTLDTKSYQLLSIWTQTQKQIPSIVSKVTWKPRYALWGCNSGLFTPGSACVDNPEYISSCACAGQFCSPQTKYKAVDAIVKEDIRQKIIYTQYPDKYLSYVNSFASKCLKQFQKQSYAQDCATNIMMNLGIDYAALQVKIDTFMTKCGGDIYESLLLDRNRFSQLGYYPAVVIDRQPIEYSSKRDLQSQLCRRLGLQKQQGCVKVLRVNTIISVTVNILFFILIIGGLAAIVFVLLMIYRKTIRKQMQKEMKMQVSASVEHYFALTQSK